MTPAKDKPTLKRYSPGMSDNAMVLADNGGWVRYTDHAQALNDKDVEIARLRKGQTAQATTCDQIGLETVGDSFAVDCPVCGEDFLALKPQAQPTEAVEFDESAMVTASADFADGEWSRTVGNLDNPNWDKCREAFEAGARWMFNKLKAKEGQGS
jgi:uncharacterized Zn finger protein (UPF0148 family)